jgi:hypothetical protein
MSAKVQQKNETYKPEVIKAVYEKLHEWNGAIDEVAKATNYHRETVRLTLLGRRKKSLPAVMEASVVILKRYNEQSKATMKALRMALEVD